MNGSAYIKNRQELWALRHHLPQRGGPKNTDPTALGYLQSLKDNLYVPLSAQTTTEFEKGDGGELRGATCNMQALHSSSALGANIFEYWRNQSVNNLKQLAKALKIPQTDIQGFAFEEKVAHAASHHADFPKSPNIDVVIQYERSIIGVECKFSEPYSGNHSGLKEAYLKHPELWDDIPSIKALAQKINPIDAEYKFLHAAQLIKHILGLKHHVSNKEGTQKEFWLAYLWYDVPTASGAQHREEIERFGKVVEQDGIRFHPISYQDLIHNMYHYGLRQQHGAYVDYLAERYL